MQRRVYFGPILKLEVPLKLAALPFLAEVCYGFVTGVWEGELLVVRVLAGCIGLAMVMRQIAITRRAGKDLAPDVATKAGIHGDTMCRLLGMFGLAKGDCRAKQALNMAGRQAEA